MNSTFRLRYILAWLGLFLLLSAPSLHVMAAQGSAAQPWRLDAPDDPAFPSAPLSATAGYSLLAENELSPTLTPNDPDRYHIALAYNSQHCQYLAVWHTSYTIAHPREIIGQRTDCSGKLVGINFTISDGANDRAGPAVAYNAINDEYLVVWMQDVLGDGKKFDLWAVRLAWTGAQIGAAFQVITYENRSFWSPEVAWNHARNEYLVVWGALAQDTQNATDIAIKILNNQGGELYGTIVTAAGFPTDPDIVWDPVNLNYLLVWNYLNTSGQLVVGGDLRDALGNRIRTVDIYGSTTQHALSPRVATSMGIFFMVVFELENSSTDHDIWVAMVNKDATASVPAALVTGPENDTHPDIAGSPFRFEYLVGYQRADPWGAKVRMIPISNNLPLESLDLCNYFSTDCLEPSVAYGGRAFYNAYLVDVPLAAREPQAAPNTPITRQHVHARLFHTSVIYLPVIRQ